MKPSRLFWPALTIGILQGCTPVAIPPQTPAEQEEVYDRERYQSKIQYNSAAPQEIAGFLRLARVYSDRMGSGNVLFSSGSPRDLDVIIDAVNEFTSINAEFTGDIPYSHPGLLDLPLIVPQSKPNEVELEQLVRYMLGGGFILDIDMGFDIYREGLEKYGGLTWGRDAWVERLPDDHPAYFSYFSIAGGLPKINLSSVSDPSKREAAQPMQGLFIGDRLAGVLFGAFASQGSLPGTTVGGSSDPFLVVDKETIRARNAQRNDPRLRQMVVNLVVFALTQEGSIAARDTTE
jgi:hypothetical protein